VQPLAALDEDQAVEGVGPASPPQADRVAAPAKGLGDGLVVEAVEGKRYHGGALGEGLGAGTGTGKGAEDLLLRSVMMTSAAFPGMGSSLVRAW
jgi:hypothetical protein